MRDKSTVIKHAINGKLLQFSLLSKRRACGTVLKGTEQMARLYNKNIEFLTRKGNIAMSELLAIHT